MFMKQKNNSKFNLKTFLLIFILCLLTAAPVFGTKYCVVEVDVSGIEQNPTGVYPVDINESGQVAVNVQGADGITNAVFFDGAQAILVPRIRPEDAVTAQGINKHGHITGYGGGEGNYTHAFVWDGTTLNDLPAIEGWAMFQAMAINDSGEVTGSGDTPEYFSASFFHDGTTMTDIGHLSEVNKYTKAYDINNSGHIIGDSRNDDNQKTAFFYDGSQVTAIGYFPGGNRSYAYAINDLDHVVGQGKNENSNYNGYIWDSANGMQNIEPEDDPEGQSIPADINNSDQVVGERRPSSGNSFAFLWENGTMYNLNDMVIGYGKKLGAAQAINDNGWILCRADDLTTFKQTSVILKPFDQGKSVIYGTVTSNVSGYNAPVQGAIVSIESLSISVQTDRNGLFQFVNIPFGDYTVTIEAEFFKKKIFTDIKLPDENGTEIPQADLKMEADQLGMVDANNNDKIDLPDAIFILQTLTGVK